MLDVNPLPDGQGGIKPGINGQVPLAALGPRSEVIKGTKSRRSQHHTVDGCLENFAAACAQKRHRFAHGFRECKCCASSLSDIGVDRLTQMALLGSNRSL